VLARAKDLLRLVLRIWILLAADAKRGLAWNASIRHGAASPTRRPHGQTSSFTGRKRPAPWVSLAHDDDPAGAICSAARDRHRGPGHEDERDHIGGKGIFIWERRPSSGQFPV